MRAFYARVTALHIVGVPDRTQQRQLEPVVSKSLGGALRAASDGERRHRKAAGNGKPPLLDGDIFSSLKEGAHQASVDRCQSEGDHAQCIVSLSFRDFFGGAHRWQDRAVLVRERGRWVVDDLAYEARWSFGNKGTLRANLREVAAFRPAPDPPKPSGAGKASRVRGR